MLHQAGSAALDGASYAYDAAGNRTSKTVLPSNLTSAYSYDPVYELTKVMQGTTQKESYAYDAVGNRTYQPGAPYTYNSSNEMLMREGVPYTYDSNGNTLSKTNGTGTTSYAWDFENHLTSVTLPGTAGTVSFKYDPLGRRVYKSSPAGSTTYVYDGDNIIEELTGSTGTIGERYTYGPGIDEPLVGQRQPQIFYYEADGLGSVTSLTTPTGTVAATYTYDSFGFMTNSTGSATNWFRYTGRQFDSDTGLYYYRARYYDPQTGRFLSEDPIGFAGGVNHYSYVDNSPPNFKDPSGLCPPQHPCAPMGSAPTPSQYAALGLDVHSMETYSGRPTMAATSLLMNLNGVLQNAANLASFHRGGSLDAQILYGGSQAYANYTYGVYLNATGLSLSTALAGANAYAALFSSYPNLKPSDFDPNYPSTPAVNVANIIQGYNDQQNGTLCIPTN